MFSSHADTLLAVHGSSIAGHFTGCIHRAKENRLELEIKTCFDNDKGI